MWCAPPARIHASAPVARLGSGVQNAVATGSLGIGFSVFLHSTSLIIRRNLVPRSTKDAGWEITEYTFDLHNSPMAEGNVMTEYEMKFASEGKPICKLIARRTGTFGQDPA